MIKKLRLKFICINMTIVTIMLIFIMGTVIHFTSLNLEQTSIQMMDKLVSNPLHMMNPKDRMNVGLPYFSVHLDKQGNIRESDNSYYNLSDQNTLPEIVEKSAEIPGRTGELSEINLRFMRINIPKGQFIVFMDMSHEIETLNTLTTNCIFIGFISFFVFLGISVFLSNWAVKPVEQAWDHQKQFISDASHELKTPLTVILTNAELINSQDYDIESKYRFLSNIQTVAVQMKCLVEGLLELSRIDNGSIVYGKESVNLSTLTHNAHLLWEPIFFEHGLTLDAQIDSSVSLQASELHLKQLWDILLDNALKYSNPHSTVTMCLKEKHSVCELSIQSYGESISDEDIKNLFKRFYRSDKSRQNCNSYGLGLSIAEGIVKAHHGKIWVESIQGTNTFYIRIPM